MPNPNSPKFVAVTGTLDGMRGAGASKRFHVEITSVTFLGIAPQSYMAEGKYLHPNLANNNWTHSPQSAILDSEGKA